MEEVKTEETPPGWFDYFRGKKEGGEVEKTEEKPYAADLEKDTLADELDKANLAEEKAEVEEKHDRVMEEIRKSDHIYPGDEEEGEDGVKGKKGLTEKLAGDNREESAAPSVVHHHEPVPHHHEPVSHHHEPVSHHHEPVPHQHEPVVHHEAEPKKGIMEEIKDKASPPQPEHHHEAEPKKGLMEKIKDKLPGHKKPEEEEHGGDVVEPKRGIMDKIKDKLPGRHPKSAQDDNIKE